MLKIEIRICTSILSSFIFMSSKRSQSPRTIGSVTVEEMSQLSYQQQDRCQAEQTLHHEKSQDQEWLRSQKDWTEYYDQQAELMAQQLSVFSTAAQAVFRWHPRLAEEIRAGAARMSCKDSRIVMRERFPAAMAQVEGQQAAADQKKNLEVLSSLQD